MPTVKPWTNSSTSANEVPAVAVILAIPASIPAVLPRAPVETLSMKVAAGRLSVAPMVRMRSVNVPPTSAARVIKAYPFRQPPQKLPTEPQTGPCRKRLHCSALSGEFAGSGARWSTAL